MPCPTMQLAEAFVDPDFDSAIVPVVNAGEQARYEPVTCGEYVLGRLDKALAHRL